MPTRLSAPPAPAGLSWPPLVRGRLIRRYKRFLADARLDTGETVTAHCPNSGRMTGCAEPGRRVYLSRHDVPTRKLKYTWELIDMPGALVGVNTQVPNRLVARAISAQVVGALTGYTAIKREVRTSPHTRLDIMLTAPGRRVCYVEVKNCTLVEEGTAMFPDAVTARGSKHLTALSQLAAMGHRAVIFFLIQRMDAQRFMPAGHIDPVYAAALGDAADAGVEMLAYDVNIDLTGICLRCAVPIHLSAD